MGTGYFHNAGQTQRLGAEFSLRGDVGPVQRYAGYTFALSGITRFDLAGGVSDAWPQRRSRWNASLQAS